MWSKHTNNLTTDIYTKWGKVTLRGIAGSAAARNHASRLAMDTRGVRLVNNQLLVMGTTATDVETTPSPAHAAGQGIADRWITTKVKSTFMSSNSVDGACIAVNTRSGDVTLTGKLGSGTERALAIELANSVRGVKSAQWEGSRR
jgi:osmotically-inducible protein OsmY